MSFMGRPIEKISLFLKLVQLCLFGRSRAVTSYKRRHHGDASSTLQRILERKVLDRPIFSRRHDY